ncbi:MAG: serine hydrolase domain-containing protein [Thermoanaerobaculia bacterium]|nr:serine hydrolase domain-containing protein [Thermoanaerobaculia bacterium]
MNVRTALSIALFAATLPAVAAEAPNLSDDPRVTDAIHAWQEWVEYQAAIDRVPAVSIAVVHDQDLLAAGGFGLADPAADRPATADTLYSICSISKLFTSVGVMRERDAGRLRLDDPVAEHLDWFDIQDIHPNDEPITIRGLLTHSAGLPRESDYPYWTAEDYPFPTHDRIVERLAEQKTLYPASRVFQYSNLGLTLAGEIVAAVSGEPFGEYMRSHILDPLEMTSTFPEIPRDVPRDRLAVGHTALGRDGSRDPVPLFDIAGIAPAAGFVSSAVDLAKFAAWQSRLLDEGGETVLRASTLREMHRVHWVDPDWETTWGLGFAVSREGDRTFVTHGGGCPGYYTHFRYQPDARLAVIALSNAIGTETGLYTLRGFDFVGPAVAAALEDPDDLPERDPALDAYVGVYGSIWGQTAIVRWQDGLAEVDLDSRDPKESLAPLRKSGEHTFVRVREDDESIPGETFLFEIGEDGVATRYLRHSNWVNRIR